MFKQVKSAFFWYYLYKFRRRVIIIVLLLIVALFANAIYSDVIEYLKIKNKLEFLEIVLISKWSLIIFNIVFSVYLILTMFKKNDEVKNKENINKKKEQKRNIFKKEIKEDIQEELKPEKFTQREKQFLHKKKLKSRADILLEK
ncbi:MAG: hypothetical protein ACERKK_08470 [Poseidonibacter sp.]|uniref:hypothetical protein n=1 Tax=Poseidonibacter sp. TaxID=2321188 RepID=UPI00359DB4E4